MWTAQALPDLCGLDPATRARIDNAVLDVFCSREFHRVGLIEIARGANVSLQTLYKYYGSKETLLFCGLDAQLGVLTSRMLDHLQGIEGSKERLRKLVWVLLDFFEKNPKVMQLVMSSVYLGSWHRKEGYYQRELVAILMKVLAEGRAEGALAQDVGQEIQLDFVVGVVQRLVQSYMLRSKPESLTLQANVLFEMIWRSIAVPPA